MPKIKENYVDVIGSLLADSGLVLASVGIDNMSTGEPVINLVFPKNPNGVAISHTSSMGYANAASSCVFPHQTDANSSKSG